MKHKPMLHHTPLAKRPGSVRRLACTMIGQHRPTTGDKDKEALFNVAYNVTDNISS